LTPLLGVSTASTTSRPQLHALHPLPASASPEGGRETATGPGLRPDRAGCSAAGADQAEGASRLMTTANRAPTGLTRGFKSKRTWRVPKASAPAPPSSGNKQ
jgi:hypothetical protein